MSEIELQEFEDIKSHTEECEHCMNLTEVLFIKIKEHKKLLESNQ